MVKTALVRVGDKYVSRPPFVGADLAQTRFLPIEQGPDVGSGRLVEAEPLTGRTHQIRVHAADRGFPILGDVHYGGTPGPRLCLHAAELSFGHPLSAAPCSFRVAPDFRTEPGLALRSGLIDPKSTTAYRLVHGAADGWPGWYVDRLGTHLLSQSAKPISKLQLAKLTELDTHFSATGAHHRQISPGAREAGLEEASPCLISGSPAPKRFCVSENGLLFELSLNEGYSVGLFLDQRDNRRRLLTGHVAADFALFQSQTTAPAVLNAFAYTCGFSVCAARAGAHVTSLDLSKKYLEWGKANFFRNRLNPDDHDFIFGDVFDWLHRFQKKRRAFDLILLDPPTFSRSKEFGPFRAEKDFPRLIAAALPLLKPKGVLFASCNTANWPAEDFLASVKTTIQEAGRSILQDHYFPQPPDFPVARAEPAYLKTYWVRLA